MVKFGVNVDLATYRDGVRETHNPPGRAHAGTVWSAFEEGASIRILNPQTFHTPLHQMCSTLQQYFKCFVGANTYLTPAGSQGFAPHFDDIEAFILQVEGNKHWRLYDNPEGQKLPRFSSRNFEQKELGPVVMDLVMQPGDLLYFPRGIVHQADAPSTVHSLHITVSTYQRNTWGDLMQKAVEGALATAIQEEPRFREGLPVDFLDHVGLVHSDKDTPQRAAYLKRIKSLFKKLGDFSPDDDAADQIAIDCVHTAMPPVLTEDEVALSAKGRARAADTEEPWTIEFDNEIRLVRPFAARVVMEEDMINLYHTVDNGMFYKAEPPQALLFPLSHATALEKLIHNPHEWIDVCMLPDLSREEQIELATTLYDCGVVLAKESEEMDD